MKFFFFYFVLVGQGEMQVTKMRNELLDHLDKLAPRLPFNTLDELIRQLGGTSMVAEVLNKLIFV